MSHEYSGIYAALVTPYTPEGAVNYAELGRLTEHLLSRGVQGFYVGGSTAEAFLLTADERKRCLETVVGASAGRGKVVCHAGDISTDRAIDLARHAAAAGADAVSAIAPFYYKFGTDEIVGYYRDIMDATDLPMFVYNFPNFSGFSLTEDVLNRLAQHPNLRGVKFTSSDFFLLERIKTAHPELAVWSGFDEMLVAGLMMGADGAVGSTYNCMPDLAGEVYRAFCAGRMDEAAALQVRMNHVIQAICKHGVFASVKTILEFDGFTFHGCRRPFAPMTDAGRAELRRVYEDYIRPAAAP